MNIKTIIILFLCVLNFNLYSQQLPIYSQYNYNAFSINPAIAGTKDFSPLFMTFRNQWAGFLDNGGGPKTQILSYHTEPINRLGIGGTLFNDKTGGAISFYGFQLGPSYHINFKGGLLSLGLSGNFYMYQFDKNGLSIDDPVYSSSSSSSKIAPSASTGIFYKKNNYFGGLSIVNIIESNLEFTGTENSSLDKHIFLHLGTNYTVFKPNDTEISLLLKKISSTNIQFDLNSKINLGDYFWTGISYRQKESASILFGVEYKELMVGYTYDYLFSDISSYSIGSHEFFVGYRFGKGEKKYAIKGCMDSTAINYNRLATINDTSFCKYEDPCPDKDGDGCCDEVDECPDEAGPGEKGNVKDCCPIKDTDGDGIEDWEDDCIEEPGPRSNNGCPVDIEVVKIINEKSITTKIDSLEEPKEEKVKVIEGKAEDVKLAIVNLKKINFELDQSVILPRHIQHLIEIVDFLQLNEDINVIIHGHTCDLASDPYNMKLSLDRAQAIKDFLLDNGIKVHRIRTKHHGEAFPLVSNETEEGREINRRVEVELEFK